MRLHRHKPPSSRARQFYLGIDGGGSRTVARVSNAEGRNVARASGGPSNPVTLGVAGARRELLDVARLALGRAGRGKLKAVCIGVAGGDRPEVSRPLKAWARAYFPATAVCVTTDAAIALEAAFGDTPGVLVIAGTGSIACGRDSEGRMLRAGGWGATIDDAGSAFDVGREGVRAALRDLDGRGPKTRLGGSIARQLNLKNVLEIVGRRLSTAEFAALAPVVTRAAGQGDLVARGIIDDAGRELAGLALALIRQRRAAAAPLQVCCAGGLFRACLALRRSFMSYLRSQAPLAKVSMLRRDPVEGALTLARKAAAGSHRPGRAGAWADIIGN
jgi:N-acetylglucosamine kinase-like BadF-type ATPase